MLIRRSEVPVWNDTLRPEKSSTASPKKSLSDLPSTNTGSKTVKKRDIIEIIDDDFTGDLPCKKPRPSDHESPTPSAQKVPGMHQKTPSPLKGKGGSANNAKHWSVGLSAEDIRKLGREVEATFLKRSSPLTSDAIEVAPSNSFDSRHKSPSSSIPPSSTTPPRRLALPTRLTPSERKFFSTPDKKVMSNADTVTAPSSSQSSELPVTASLSHEIISFNNDVDASFVRQSASTDEEDTPARAGNLMSVEVDTSTSIAFSLGIEERPADNTLRCDNDKAEVRTCGLLAEITRKPDGADLSEDETQEIQRMCTEDILVDPQEYEMAENFLRQYVIKIQSWIMHNVLSSSGLSTFSIQTAMNSGWHILTMPFSHAEYTVPHLHPHPRRHVSKLIMGPLLRSRGTDPPHSSHWQRQDYRTTECPYRSQLLRCRLVKPNDTL